MATPAPPIAPNQPQYRVLLIGIDDYHKRPLQGCVNDIDAMQAILLDGVGVPTDRIRRLASPRNAKHSTLVPQEPATLDNIRNALAALVRDAQEGERIFIYYAGHGARAPFERGDGFVFHRESLVPEDVDRGPDKRLLADYELNGLLRQIARRTPSVTVMLDCCHSAGVTRDPGVPEMRSRGLHVRDDLGWTAPLRAGGELAMPSPRTRGGDDPTERTVDTCHVVAACLNHELAMECTDASGVDHGVLTDAFRRALSDVPRSELRTIAWTRIWQKICAQVKAHSPWQSPWMAGHPLREVFAGPPVEGDAGLSIRRTGDTYEIDAGELASVTKGTRIAVYGETPQFFPVLRAGAPDTDRRGVIEVSSTQPSSATAVALGAPFDVPPGARGRIIEVGEPARLTCAILSGDGTDDGGKGVIAAALHGSRLIRVVGRDAAAVRLERAGGLWLLTDDKHKETVDTALVVLEPRDLPQVRAVLEHYYRYALPLRMAAATRDLPGQLELRVLACDRELSPAAPQHADLPDAPTEIPDGTTVCFRVSNRSRKRLRVTLLNSAASGKVQLLGDTEIDSRDSYVFWAGNQLGKPFAMTVPRGKRQAIDRLTAIGTTVLTKDLRSLRVDRTFEDILAITRGATRGITRGVREDDEVRTHPPTERWTSASAILTTRL